MYTYKSPIDKGYERIYLTKKVINKHFPKYMKETIFVTNEIYKKDDHLIVQSMGTKINSIFVTILFPLAVIIHGVGNLKGIFKEYKRELNPKKYGAFTENTIDLKRENWKDLKEYLDKSLT